MMITTVPPGMTENQKNGTRKDMPLAPLFHTILAAQNKTSLLFVKNFHYQGENIATKHLGQIFGFFEIPDTQEDNAYIVNFLASVVKKEYFVNPKRSAADSFEAALHKVNLALAELVRQGNTAWLGKLHGVVAVIANNSFHFSVTGDGAIILYRENQATLISEGLADKDAALHPLKTFLEISSGALIPEDKILITSPELLELCESETLRKNAFRMDENGFARYVRAALVNEAPLGVSLIVDLAPAPEPVRPKKKSRALREASLEKLQNVFSDASFKEPTKETSTTSPMAAESSQENPEELPREYTDKKTGHIYVQGESHDELYTEPSFWQAWKETFFRPALTSTTLFLKRFTKKSRKALAKQATLIGAESKVIGQSVWKLSKEKSSLLAKQSQEVLKSGVQSLKNHQTKPADDFAPVTIVRPETPPLSPETPLLAPESETATLPEIETALPPDLQGESSDVSAIHSRRRALERFSQSYERPQKAKLGTKSAGSFLSVITSVKEKVQRLFSLVGKLSGKQKLFLGALILIILGIIITFRLLNAPTAPSEAQLENSVTPAADFQNPAIATPAPLANAASRLSWDEGTGMLIVTPDDASVIAVTPKSIIASDKSYALPVNGTIEAATYMPDLKMVFLWSSTKELVSWSVVDKKFTANVLPLPANTEVSLMGAYLTYLYVLDTKAGTINRFARTEGGFSEPTSWLRSPLAKDNTQDFVVNDTIRIAGSTLDQYLRGTKERTLSEDSYQVLGTSNNKTFTLAVETGSGKLAIWNADANQVYEGTHEELKNITALTYNENTKKLLVAKDQNLIEYSLEW